MTRRSVEHANEHIYAEWHQPLLEELFGHESDLHHDLYEMTHSHRREHNGGTDEGACIAWPSPPYRAPVWRIVADAIGATRFLEVGTGLGYTAALMADAGGPGCWVDTIENDPLHAEIAGSELSRRGLDGRVRVLLGDAAEVVADLTVPYDVVFLDGDVDVLDHADRLLRPGGARPEIKGLLQEPLISILGGLRASLDSGVPEATALSQARESYRDAVIAALEESSRSWRRAGYRGQIMSP